MEARGGPPSVVKSLGPQYIKLRALYRKTSIKGSSLSSPFYSGNNNYVPLLQSSMGDSSESASNASIAIPIYTARIENIWQKW